MATNDAGMGKALGKGGKREAPKAVKAPLSQDELEALVGFRDSGRTSEFMQGRRSMAYELTDKGLLQSQKLAMEVLYLLPDDFVKFYEALFHRALMVKDNSAMSGKGGGVEKARGRTSMQLGQTERGPQAAGSGKRWKNPAYTIGDEIAFEVKGWMDRELGVLVRKAVMRVRDQGALRADSAPNSGSDGGVVGVRSSSAPIRCPGLRAEWVDRGDGTPRPKCGLFLKAEYRFCPTCGTRVVRMQVDGPVGDQVRQE